MLASGDSGQAPSLRWIEIERLVVDRMYHRFAAEADAGDRAVAQVNSPSPLGSCTTVYLMPMYSNCASRLPMRANGIVRH